MVRLPRRAAGSVSCDLREGDVILWHKNTNEKQQMASCAGYGWSAMSASGITSSKKMDGECNSWKPIAAHADEPSKLKWE